MRRPGPLQSHLAGRTNLCKCLNFTCRVFHVGLCLTQVRLIRCARHYPKWPDKSKLPAALVAPHRPTGRLAIISDGGADRRVVGRQDVCLLPSYRGAYASRAKSGRRIPLLAFSRKSSGSSSVELKLLLLLTTARFISPHLHWPASLASRRHDSLGDSD